jgi:hypothetical protein
LTDPSLILLDVCVCVAAALKWLHLKHQTLNIAISIVCTKIIAKDYQLTNSAFYLPVFRNTSIFQYLDKSCICFEPWDQKTIDSGWWHCSSANQVIMWWNDKLACGWSGWEKYWHMYIIIVQPHFFKVEQKS